MCHPIRNIKYRELATHTRTNIHTHTHTQTHTHAYTRACTHTHTHTRSLSGTPCRELSTGSFQKDMTMGWLRSVGSITLQVSFAEYCLFYRSLLQKRPIILSILLTVATPQEYQKGMLRNVERNIEEFQKGILRNITKEYFIHKGHDQEFPYSLYGINKYQYFWATLEGHDQEHQVGFLKSQVSFCRVSSL